jgi:uncharacterized MnhB-related membrane protein
MMAALHCLVVLALVLVAFMVARVKDLLSSAIALAAFGLLLSLEFYLLRAPDVAIAEAGIGAGLTTAILVMAIRAVRKPPTLPPKGGTR